MKKILLILACLSIFNAGCGQKTERYNMNEVGHKNGINYVKSTMEPVNGIVYGEYENGQLMLESHFKNGKYHGFARTWHENGELHTESSWENEKEDGLFSLWYENGQKEMEENYVDGKLMSQKFWDKNGVERRVLGNELTRLYTENSSMLVEKNKDGYPIFTGIAFDIFNNGQLKTEISVIDGKQNGLFKHWYKDGQIKELGYMKDDELDGLQKSWYENGQLQFEASYKEDEAYGAHKTWYENGQLMTLANFKNGNPISFKCWDINGLETDCSNVTP